MTSITDRDVEVINRGIDKGMNEAFDLGLYQACLEVLQHFAKGGTTIPAEALALTTKIRSHRKGPAQ